MRVFVKVCSDRRESKTYAIPCNEPTITVGVLKSLALDRWSEDNGGGKKESDLFQLTLSGNSAILSDKDLIEDVLRDGEFIDLCKLHTLAKL